MASTTDALKWEQLDSTDVISELIRKINNNFAQFAMHNGGSPGKDGNDGNDGYLTMSRCGIHTITENDITSYLISTGNTEPTSDDIDDLSFSTYITNNTIDDLVQGDVIIFKNQMYLYDTTDKTSDPKYYTKIYEIVGKQGEQGKQGESASKFYTTKELYNKESFSTETLFSDSYLFFKKDDDNENTTRGIVLYDGDKFNEDKYPFTGGEEYGTNASLILINENDAISFYKTKDSNKITGYNGYRELVSAIISAPDEFKIIDNSPSGSRYYSLNKLSLISGESGSDDNCSIVLNGDSNYKEISLESNQLIISTTSETIINDKITIDNDDYGTITIKDKDNVNSLSINSNLISSNNNLVLSSLLGDIDLKTYKNSINLYQYDTDNSINISWDYNYNYYTDDGSDSDTDPDFVGTIPTIFISSNLKLDSYDLYSTNVNATNVNTTNVNCDNINSTNVNSTNVNCSNLTFNSSGNIYFNFDIADYITNINKDDNTVNDVTAADDSDATTSLGRDYKKCKNLFSMFETLNAEIQDLETLVNGSLSTLIDKVDGIEVLPIGSIIMSYVADDDKYIKAGWLSCDNLNTKDYYNYSYNKFKVDLDTFKSTTGSYFTPNFCMKFPMGTRSKHKRDDPWGSTNNPLPKNWGGNNSVTLSVANLPSHNHRYAGNEDMWGSNPYYPFRYEPRQGVRKSGSDSGSGYMYYTECTGSNQAFSILPPYQQLYFYIKVVNITSGKDLEQIKVTSTDTFGSIS